MICPRSFLNPYLYLIPKGEGKAGTSRTVESLTMKSCLDLEGSRDPRRQQHQLGLPRFQDSQV